MESNYVKIGNELYDYEEYQGQDYKQMNVYPIDLDGELFYVPYVGRWDEGDSYILDGVHTFIYLNDRGLYNTHIGDDIEKYSESNISFIDKMDMNTLLSEPDTVLDRNSDLMMSYNTDDVFAPDLAESDNLLTRAIKKGLKLKDVNLSVYNNRFEKEYDKSNYIKSIQSNITEKKFTPFADILDMEYCLILKDKRNCSFPMGQPVISTSDGWEMDDSVIEALNGSNELIDTNEYVDIVPKKRKNKCDKEKLIKSIEEDIDEL